MNIPTPIDFHPSDVDVGTGGLPLTATLGRTEREIAAAYLVLTLQHLGADWDRAVTYDELRAAVLASKDDPRFAWLASPFTMPDFPDLIAHGQALRLDSERMLLADVAIAAMRRHVRVANDGVCSSCGTAPAEEEGTCADCLRDVQLAGDDLA